MNNSDYGIYGLLAGVEKASTDLNASPSQIRASIFDLSNTKSKFLNKIKKSVLEKSMKESTKAAAKHFGISEYVIIEILKKYLTEEASAPGNLIYPYDSYDRFTQTCELPAKNWLHVASQTDLPYKIPKKSYSTIEKIQEIRKSLQNSSVVSAGNIEKWKEKIIKGLFKEDHYQMYADTKKINKGTIKFFKDVDAVLVDWYKQVHPSDEKLKEKCVEVAGFGEESLNISEEWVNTFKSHHQLA